jgi:predicted nucleic acid-binding protein
VAALRPLYLADTSAWAQTGLDDRALDRMETLARHGQLAICAVTLAEMLYSARNAEDMSDRVDEYRDLVHLSMNSAAERQVTASMVALAERGQHRRPIPDILVAAIAWAHDAVILHYDKDFDLIAEVTGQRSEWIVERGTGHRKTV